jgi:hypothetical protein
VDCSPAMRSGEVSLLDEDPLGYVVVRGRGDNSVGVSVSVDSAVSRSGLKVFKGIAFDGRAGSDLSTSAESFSFDFAAAFALDFFRRLAINDS